MIRFFRFILSRKFLFFLNFFCVAVSLASLSLSIKLAKNYYADNNFQKEEIRESEESQSDEKTENSEEKKSIQDILPSDNKQEIKNHNSEYIELLKNQNKEMQQTKTITKKEKKSDKEIKGKKENKKELKLENKKETKKENKKDKKKEEVSKEKKKKFQIQLASFDDLDKAKKFLKSRPDSKTLKIKKIKDTNGTKYKVFLKKSFINKKEAEDFGKKTLQKNFFIKEEIKK